MGLRERPDRGRGKHGDPLEAAFPKGESPVKEGQGLKPRHERRALHERDSPAPTTLAAPPRCPLKAAAEAQGRVAAVRAEGRAQVTSDTGAPSCISLGKLRKMPGSVRAQLGGGAVGGPPFASLHPLHVFVKDRTL